MSPVSPVSPDTSAPNTGGPNTGAPNTDLAIVGIGIELPGAHDIEAYWRIISSGTSLTRPFPADRGQLLTEYVRYLRATTVEPVADTGVDYYDGCYLDEVDGFDHAVFGMNPKQAATTDPHQRLALRTMYRAMEDAGHTGDRVRGSRTGVFVGFATNPGSTYLDYICRTDPALAQLALTGNIPTMMANRLSHVLDLRGPSLVVDTACSASLVAVHQAKNALRAGDCDLAVVGGARIVFAPVRHPHTRIGIEAADGITRTFDESADGTGFGEGAGAVVLKRLADAIADGDRIHAVLKGTAVNHDGRTEGITNPDSDSQAELLLAAWRDAGVEGRSIGYLEAHGTATSVGDPVEYEGLRRAFARQTADLGFCAVGAVKANIGHLFESSGVVGLIKAALTLKYRTIPPLANFKVANPSIDFAAGPLYVPTAAEPWTAEDGPRRSGVSAFGLGGTNAHAVLEEYTAPPAPPAAPGPRLFALSAATPASLEQLVRRYLALIDRGGLGGVEFADVCHTARVSRAAHRHRLAVIAGDLAQLRAGLAQGTAGTLTDLTTDPTDPTDPTALDDPHSPHAAATTAATAWLAGGTLAPLPEPDGRLPRIVDLPGYVYDDATGWIAFPDDWRERLAIAPEERHPATHSVEFRPAPAPGAPQAPVRVLALVGPEGPGGDARAALTAAAGGHELRVLRLAEPGSPQAEEPDRFTLDPASLDRIAELVLDHDYTHVVHALAFERGPAASVDELDRRVRTNLRSLFLLAKSLMTHGVKTTLAVLSRQAVPAEQGEVCAVENASLVGLAKAVTREYPYLSTLVVDVDDAVPAEALGARLLAPEPGVFVLRGERELREFFAELPEVPADGPAEYLRPGGVYLITGGTGALGLAVARWFAERQSGLTLVLLSRSGLPPREQWPAVVAAGPEHPMAERVLAVQELAELGATVEVRATDAGDPAALAAAATELLDRYGRIDGIVHAAGLPGGSTLIFREPDDFDAVLRPKMHGAFVLDQATRDNRPDFVVHFSSVAAVFPAPGQGDYAAANYYLDALAAANADRRCHVLAVDWVAWREIGMAVTYGSNGDTTFKSLPTATALSIMDAGLRSRTSRIFAGEAHYGGELIHLLDSFDVALAPEVGAKVTAAVAAAEGRLRQAADRIRSAVAAVTVELTGRPEGDYTPVERTIARCMAQAFGYAALDLEDDFFDLGGDSIMAASVAGTISACLGVRFDVADLLADRTISEIAYHLESSGELPFDADTDIDAYTDTTACTNTHTNTHTNTDSDANSDA
ncbi:SDR family NAD(P)-dependent oxidoreductase [Kitasatospora sp. NBC_01287]|uniref:type I polyketide synthase n=1 Tax=Kitasatospora sp. NBC_01287 TaxID=2903573 RepID=UPI00225BCFB0|nr:type I polyketide synthase [Kitasatospora sp. NBC_01287]MCX4751656.1 SDR family NAD(P)-dependent oxidoreductase [Kitasatospora sp. NBC_01287]